MIITSSVFENNGEIPTKYTCEGEFINPPLSIKEIPNDAVCYALIVKDPDAPVGLWVHWMVWNISKDQIEIAEDAVLEGVIGKNSSGNKSWDDICPPDKEHRYLFKVFALDSEIELNPDTATRDDFYKVVGDHTVAEAQLVGRYNLRKNR